MEAEPKPEEAQVAELVAKIVDLEEEVLTLRQRVRVLSTALTEITLQSMTKEESHG